jgi:hypothetical protein
VPGSSPPDSALSVQLAEACRRMAELDLPRPLAARLHRQFIAVCDAVKAPGADEAIGQRRLAAFMAELDKAVQSGTQSVGGCLATPVSVPCHWKP